MPDNGSESTKDRQVDELLQRCTFPPPGTAVTCAVSGGADSLALLVLASGAGCRVTAVHVDHGLRAGSTAEADVVGDAATRVGARFTAERIQVAPGPNLEARARAARYAVLPPDVMTGHTADDQAETVLLNLLRGAGLDGLAGMAPPGSPGSGPVRPILGLRRRETAELCRAWGLEPVADPSNDDPAHRRNRVRHQLLPLLDAIAERDVVAVLARQAAFLRDEAALLDDLAAPIDATDAAALAAAPVALARRAVRRWLAAGSEHPPGSAAVERVLAVARGETRATEVDGGRRVARTGGRLRLETAGDGR
jgi:tRNA(Ile)-lysidine synthase